MRTVSEQYRGTRNGCEAHEVDVCERVGMTGRVRLAVYDAEFEPVILEDPERLLHLGKFDRYCLRRDPWRANKIVANTVAGFGNGLNILRDFLAAEMPPPPTHLAWGTNGTAPAVTDVGLYAEQVRNEIVARSKGDKQVIIAGFMGTTTGNGFDFREIALVTGLTSAQSRILARAAINSIAKNSNVIIAVNWQLDLA